MRLLRIFGGALAFAAVLGFFTGTAQARSARSNDRSGKTRLIDRDKNDENSKQKKQEQAQEEAKKKAEEAKKKADEAKKKPVAQQPKPAQPARPAATPPAAKPTKTAKKPARKGGPAKTDDALEQEAEKLWAEATGAFEKGELLPGVKALRQILAECDGTQAAQRAQDQLDLLLDHPQFGPMILQAEADDLFGEQHYRRAWNKYRALLARYPNAEQAAEARAKLAEIDEKDLLSKSVYTDEEIEDARLWFLAGSIHLENGRRDDALTAWRKVIEEYPGCRYAAMAEQKLDEALGTKSVASNP